MSDYCEKCKRCHDDGLRNDDECCHYGEPNGCNHPNHGYGVIVDKYEALQKENAELRECLEKLAKKLRCPTEDGKPKKGIWCGNCREICDADGTNWCDRNVYFPIIEAALEGGNDEND